MPKIAIYPLIHREAWFSTCFVRQNQQKTNFFCTAILDHFQTKCSNLRPLLSITFPRGFRILKNFGHPTSGSGGKKTFKQYLKSEQTDRHTDRRTNRLIESIGPEGRCFENYQVFTELSPRPIQSISHNVQYNGTICGKGEDVAW